MSDNQDEPNISFVQHELPTLKAGEYELTVGQSIYDNSDHPRASLPILTPKSYRFAVYSERFQLRLDQVVKVFPPEDSHGDYTQALPHVMLSRTTLPWERSPYDDATKDPAQNKDATPWLAVLLFDQDDPPPTTQTALSRQGGQHTVRELGPKEVHLGDPSSVDAKHGLLPTLTRSYFQQGTWEKLLDYGETLDDPCQVIDVPVALWKQVAPTRQDLPWLAHTRTAQYSDSEPQSYALVIGNRLPVADHTSTAHLVSLEYIGDCLPDDGKQNDPPGLDGVKYIRLVSLKSWQFTTEKVADKEAHSKFVSLLENLNSSRGSQEPVDGLLRRPLSEKLDSGDPHFGYIHDMLAQGYTALPYQTRTGQGAVSWYRGPFVPVWPSDKDILPANVKLPAESADDLIFLDTDNNVYNTSYGAAWQIGRMLALANRNFATGLYRWKMDQVQKTVQAVVQEANLDRRQRSMFYHEVTSRLQNEEMIAQLYIKAPDMPADLLAWKDSLYVETRDLKAPDLPDDLLAWLADLYILRGVPFWYMLPDESMLPPESLRFFLADRKWVACLIDGATSIGRATASAWSHDQAFAAKWFEQISGKVGSEPPRLLSGFLLRSQAVKGWWPGIRVEGYGCEKDDQGKPLPLRQLRLDLLSDSTLLALFDGEIAQVKIHEPLEGIHFCYPHYPQPLPENWPRATGVLDINAIASDEAGKTTPPFTAAEFALAMVDKTQRVVFSLGKRS